MEQTTISGYTLQYKLGDGGMAEVWYAENRLLQPAAVKILQKRFCYDPEVVQRFENEARLMVQLTHPNIRRVQHFTTIGGRPCMVMEYLQGEDLAQRLKKGERFSNEQLLPWWNDLVDALAYTHQKNIIHRDIKPSNLFITNAGIIKILDFGIAKIRDNITVTQTGSRMGTPLYMSPEQVYDLKSLTHKTDIYSLAVSFYHIVTGTPPYDTHSVSDFEIQERIVRKKLNTDLLPAPWNAILTGYLHKNPEERQELQKITSTTVANPFLTIEPLDPEPEQPTPVATRALQEKHSRSSWALVFLSFLIVAGLVVMALNSSRVMAFFNSFTTQSPAPVVKKEIPPVLELPEAPLPAVVPPDTTLSVGEEGTTDSVITRISDQELELNAKNLLTDYYNNRNNCGNMYRYFGDTVKQYFNKSNVSLDQVMKECQTYHSKWKFTEAEFDENSFVFSHQQNGNQYVDFSMLYKIKQQEADEWTSYQIDVSAIIDPSMKITRIVERRIEKL